MQDIAEWDSFYVIVGSAAGALIGLQFVVMTLMAQNPPRRSSPSAAAAYATPTVLHFSAVLLLCALMRAPWRAIAPVAVFCGLLGAAGVLYGCLTGWRMQRQTAYRPAAEDWLFHVLGPLAAYGALAAAAVTIAAHEREALFGVGGAALLLLFAGVHNAWDAVAYHVFVNLPRSADE